ncbi:hypothetical protein DPMN_024900 [Dreissena polymorpha]|uniref:Uncharacterized protein n=1 Tax=Dreissena polymorpha TaxID=45954 RepID=A0A9D4RB69_DREPO|nr:hypothetical protein DPMN_024900 [Dreissena polymorpha]
MLDKGLCDFVLMQAYCIMQGGNAFLVCYGDIAVTVNQQTHFLEIPFFNSL